jgi:thioredoxin-dependent peroxiredoxin
MIKVGSKAPEFTLKDQDGNKVALGDFRGKKVVLYFYPKDDTPGCTTEACGFRDAYDDMLSKGAAVIGVSADSAESHGAFRKKYKLPFLLASDPDMKAINAYGVWGEKMSFGKKTTGILRTTFVIDEDGIVERVFEKVKPEDHAKEILESLG